MSIWRKWERSLHINHSATHLLNHSHVACIVSIEIVFFIIKKYINIFSKIIFLYSIWIILVRIIIHSISFLISCLCQKFFNYVSIKEIKDERNIQGNNNQSTQKMRESCRKEINKQLSILLFFLHYLE